MCYPSRSLTTGRSRPATWATTRAARGRCAWRATRVRCSTAAPARVTDRSRGPCSSSCWRKCMTEQPMPTPLDLETIAARAAAATPGPWQEGRHDMQSYDGETGEAFTNVYHDE